MSDPWPPEALDNFCIGHPSDVIEQERDMSDLGKAIALAADVFKDITDKSGRPYIEHCLYVMEGVRHYGDTYMIVGVLHDVVEDTDVTLDDLFTLGFSTEVVGGVDALTRRDNEEYDFFIRRCSLLDLSTRVKLVDIEHNMQASRLKGLRKKDFDRLAKYALAYEYLKD